MRVVLLLLMFAIGLAGYSGVRQQGHDPSRMEMSQVHLADVDGGDADCCLGDAGGVPHCQPLLALIGATGADTPDLPAARMSHALRDVALAGLSPDALLDPPRSV